MGYKGDGHRDDYNHEQFRTNHLNIKGFGGSIKLKPGDGPKLFECYHTGKKRWDTKAKTWTCVKCGVIMDNNKE